MSTTISSETSSAASRAHGLDLKLEVVVIPVADVDRAKRFYGSLGWRLDADIARGEAFRVVQFTPPGSPCSIQFGKGMTAAAPGSAQNSYLVVSDIAAAHAELAAAGVDVSDIFHRTEDGQAGGPDPEHRSYASFVTFRDPDGNSWLVQEVNLRRPGRVDANLTTFSSASELARALQRAAIAHGEHEKRIGQHDAQWPVWYAEYMVQEQAGKPLPQ
jgi:catechol 2,3-dioxygenase-like lactoylglutathione lyase family enzyme